MPFCRVGGIQLYYEMSGEGIPLLLINGLSADTRQWEFLLQALGSSPQIIRYDMRCAGKSDKPSAPFAIEGVAREARGLLRELGIARARVLGFSMGGMIAMRLALASPELVERLIIVASAPSFRGPYPVSQEVRSLLRRTDVSPELLAQVYRVCVGSIHRQKVPVGEYIAFRLSDPTPQPAEAYLQQLDAIESFDMVGEVEAIDVPADVVVGEEDALIPPDNARWLHEHLRGSRLTILPGVGHMIPIEAPRELAAIVREKGQRFSFCRKIPLSTLEKKS